MRISDVLRVKGREVVTVTSDVDVQHLLSVLAEHRIGAVVVSHDGTSVDGIVSERDIVRALAERGATAMIEPVTAIYTAEVLTRVEREVFIAVRVDGKSRAAVGRELAPPLTGQRVGQIVAHALIKVQAYVTEREQAMTSAKTSDRSG